MMLDKPALPHPSTRRKLTVDARIVRHLDRHPEGVDALTLRAWLASCRKVVFSFWDVDEALGRLQTLGEIHCANKIWYRRLALKL